MDPFFVAEKQVGEKARALQRHPIVNETTTNHLTNSVVTPYRGRRTSDHSLTGLRRWPSGEPEQLSAAEAEVDYVE